MPKRRSFINVIILSIIVLLPFTFINTKEGQASTQKFNMSYLYFGNKSNHVQYVDRTNGALQLVSPSYFDLNEDGTLKLSNLFDVNFIEEMREREIRVVPFLSNHWNREKGRKALENRDVLAREIKQVIEEYDLDGIHLDIENLTHEDRENYTDFVKILRDILPDDKEVSIAVSANPIDIETGWQGSYDYEELAKYCDYLMIMTYDQSYYGSLPGPVASIGFVEDSIKYALERVPAEQIVLGIPFYGRYWNLSESKGGRGIHLTDLDTLIELYDADVFFDEYTMSPRAEFEIELEDSTFSVFGRKLNPGNYVMWFENESSIKAKLDLVKKYDLKGTGSWSLGQELPETWNYFTAYLNDTDENNDSFNDIKDHWAEEEILKVKDKGLMKGYDNGFFMPDSFLTRSQAAVIIVRAFELESLDYKGNNFEDVPINHWAKQEIQIAWEHGIVKGVNEESFLPERPVTREEMAALLARILDFQDVSTDLNLAFDDVDLNMWSYNSIYAMTYHGLIRGFEDYTFRPRRNITRGEIAVLLNRVDRYQEKSQLSLK